MKTSCKRLAALVLLAIAAFTISDPPKAEAQQNLNQYAPQTLTATNNMPANTTNVVALSGNVISATRMEEVAISISFVGLASGTANTDFTFNPGLEGSTNFATLNPYVFTVPANNTTQVIFTTNVFLGAQGYLALTAVGNRTGGAAISNIVVKAVTKPKFWR